MHTYITRLQLFFPPFFSFFPYRPSWYSCPNMKINARHCGGHMTHRRLYLGNLALYILHVVRSCIFQFFFLYVILYLWRRGASSSCWAGDLALSCSILSISILIISLSWTNEREREKSKSNRTLWDRRRRPSPAIIFFFFFFCVGRRRLGCDLKSNSKDNASRSPLKHVRI